MVMLELRDSEDWIQAYLQPRYPDLVDDYRALELVYNKATRSRVLDADDLALLTTEAKHPSSSIIRDTSAELVGRLADEFPAARQAIVELLCDRKVIGRNSAMMALLYHHVSPLYAELLPQALNDKSMQVRWYAAHIIHRHGLFELAPALKLALVAETHVSTRASMEKNLALLTDGYFIRRDDESPTLWVTIGSGSVTATSSYRDDDDWETRGKPRLARSANPGTTRIPQSFPAESDQMIG